MLTHYPYMKIGYARVSTADQNLDMQRDALTRAGCEKIFEEKKSGKAGSKRPELEAALTYLRPEDVLVVWKLDRLGRSLVEMIRTVDKLRADDIKFRRRQIRGILVKDGDRLRKDRLMNGQCGCAVSRTYLLSLPVNLNQVPTSFRQSALSRPSFQCFASPLT